MKQNRAKGLEIKAIDGDYWRIRSRMRFLPPSPLSEISYPLPLDLSFFVPPHTSNLVVVVAPSSASVEQKSSHSFLDLCFLHRNQHSFTAFIHSLKIQINRFWNALASSSIAGTTSSHPVSLLPKPPPSATCACFPLSGDQRNITSLFTSTFRLISLPKHSRPQTAPSSKHTFTPA